MITSKQKKILLLSLFLLTVGITFAQTTPPNPNPPPPGLPIDAGAFFLGFIALVYGYIKKK